MQPWRRVSTIAIAALSAFVLVACSGTDGGDDGEGGSGNDDITSATNAELDPPDDINFSQIEVGGKQTEPVEIGNNGEATLEVDSIKLVEGNEDDVKEFQPSGDWPSKTEIQSDGEIELGITYAPKNATQDSGHILLETNDHREDFQSYKIQLKPQGLAPRLITTSQVNFSGVAPDTRASQRVTLKNEGQAELNIEKITLTGSELFEVKQAVDQDLGGGNDDDKEGEQSEGDGEPAGPKPEDDDPISAVEGTSLQPGDSVDLRVYFMPEDDSPEEGELIIHSNDQTSPQKTIALLGNSGSPCLGLSHQEEVNFGASSIDQTANKTVTVENCRSQAEDLELRDVEVTDDAGGVFSVDKSSLPGELADGNKFVISGDDRANFVVRFEPEKIETYEGTLLINSNDPSRQAHQVKLIGKGSDNKCPDAIAEASVKGNDRQTDQIETLPLETIKFDGSGSNDKDGEVSRYEWSIIDRPQDSTARLTPSANVEKPELFLDLAGEYKVELVVYDDEDAGSCGKRAIVEITAIPQNDIHVQLVWDTPADPNQTDTNGADLDLHYLNPKGQWNESPYDIFWHNKTGDWGQENYRKDNPSLDIDDTDGAGPENVNHNNPNTGLTYSVGVYYYDDNGFGPSYATVRLYIDGSLEREYKNKYMSGTFDFWKVGLIEWPSKNIYKRDEKFQGFPN